MKTLIVEKDKLIENIEIIKKIATSKVIAVLKGNGYGLGLIEFANVLLGQGVDFFAVSELEEALLLRSNGFTSQILLLTPFLGKQTCEVIVNNNIIPTISTIALAKELNSTAEELGKTIAIHLKIDTGFGRFGFLWNELSGVAKALNSFENLLVAGTYSHFSFSFSKEPDPVNTQYSQFLKAVETLKSDGLDTGMLHIANSCAFLRFPSMHLDAVRVGSAFLGRIPIENTYSLNRIGVLVSEVIEIKTLPSNHFIGYANTYQTKRETKIGIIPVGYKDGFGVEKSRDTFRIMDTLRYIYNDLRSYKKKMYINISGKTRVPIIGRISMFNIVVDLTDTNVIVGDRVFLEINPVLIPPNIPRLYINIF